MKTIVGTDIFGEPKTIADKIAYMEIALKYLAENKGITLHINSCKEDSNTLCSYVYGETCGDAAFNYTVSNTIFIDDVSLWETEPHYRDWSFEKRLILRLAKLFFEGYKDWKSKQNTINSITLGPATYDVNINGRSVSTTISVVDNLQDKIKDLEDKNDQLEKELEELRAMKDMMWNIMQQKGLV